MESAEGLQSTPVGTQSTVSTKGEDEGSRG